MGRERKSNMELLRLSFRKSCCPSAIVRVLSFYSTASADSLSSFSSSPWVTAAADDSLFRRISPAGNPNASIVPILDQWLHEGRHVHRDDIQFIVKRLKLFRRYSHALQVSEWGEKMYSELSPRDISTRLELISKVHGLDQAEKYYDSLPPPSRGPQVYYALLQSYAHAKSLEKAEDLMLKLDKLGWTRSSVPFNIMMKLYAELRMYEKLDQIMQQMEEKGVWWSKYTCNIRLNAYASISDIRGMESFLGKLERDPLHTVDWIVCMAVANGYLNAGLIDKCVIMLKRVERLAMGQSKKRAHQFLLTMYGRAKKKDEVYRIWEMCKSRWNLHNKWYLYMVSALVKADDLEGAEKVVNEFNSGTKAYDYRIINVLIRAYGRKGEFERAEALVSKGMKHGLEPPPTSTWDILAAGYCMHNQMEAAVKTFIKALLAEPRGWKLNRLHLSACLTFLKQKEDSAELEEFTSLLGKFGYPFVSETQLLGALEQESSDQIDEGDAEMEKIISPFDADDGLHS